MTSQDMDRLWVLLGELFEHTKNLDPQKRKAAWLLSFKKYEYTQIRQAVLDLARKQKYFPTVAEVAALLPEDQEQEAEEGQANEAVPRVPLEDFFGNCVAYAGIFGISPPESPEDALSWWRQEKIRRGLRA